MSKEVKMQEKLSAQRRIDALKQEIEALIDSGGSLGAQKVSKEELDAYLDKCAGGKYEEK